MFFAFALVWMAEDLVKYEMPNLEVNSIAIEMDVEEKTEKKEKYSVDELFVQKRDQCLILNIAVDLHTWSTAYQSSILSLPEVPPEFIG